MKHSQRDSERAEQDLAHLRQLRSDAHPTPAAGQPGDPSRGPAGPPVASEATGRTGGDPAAGTSSGGAAHQSGPDPEAGARSPGAPAAPVASDSVPGAVVGPSGPLAGDLPVPPAMHYPAGPPLGPAPGQHRVTETGGSTGASGATTTLARPAMGEWVTCPECGESQTIDPAQRRAEDFCKRCDFPLFWARSAVVPLSTDETGASLRRLPGTVGRAATASVACPHCGEPNSPTAIICIRCSQAMVIPEPEPEPEPEPIYVPPPPEPEPEPGFPLWWVVGACVALVIITVVVAWIALAV